MKLCFILLCCPVVLLFYGCETCSSKKIDCGAFSDEIFVKWFPYKKGDQLIFKNDVTAAKDTFLLTDLHPSASYETSTGGYGGGAKSCNSNIVVSSVLDSNTYYSNFIVQYNISEELNNGAKTFQLSFSLKGSRLQTGEIKDLSIEKPVNYDYSSTVENSSNAVLNGVAYSNLATVIQDTSNSKFEKVYKIFIAKGHGVIGYETYPDLQRWIKQ